MAAIKVVPVLTDKPVTVTAPRQHVALWLLATKAASEDAPDIADWQRAAETLRQALHGQPGDRGELVKG